MRNKKALSQIVSVTVIILITIVAIGVIWTAINGFLKDRMQNSESCLYSIEKIKLNPQYTCYNASTNETLISIFVGDLNDLTSILIGIGYESESKTFILNNETKQFDNLLNYPSRTTGITMPKKEQGRTFILTDSSIPQSIKIAPKIGKKQCDTLDEISQITSCI